MKFFNLFRLHQTDNIKTKNINKKRADTKKISEVKKGNEAKRIAEAKKLAEFKKGFDDFTSIISHNPIGDSRVIIESTICQLKNIFANTKNKKSDSLYLQRKTISHPILLNLLSHMQGKA